MIVSSMSFDEVREKVLKEIPEMQLRTMALFPEVKKQMLKAKMKKANICREIYSAAKNHYFVFYNFSGKHPDDAKISTTLHLNDDSGFRTISPMLMGTELSIQIFTGHFYKRYNERNNLGLIKPFDIIKHFHKQNQHYKNDYSEAAYPDGSLGVFSIIETGAMLGLHYRDLLVTVYKTFVDNKNFFNEQVKQRESLMENVTVKEDFLINDTLELKLKIKQSLNKKVEIDKGKEEQSVSKEQIDKSTEIHNLGKEILKLNAKFLERTKGFGERYERVYNHMMALAQIPVDAPEHYEFIYMVRDISDRWKQMNAEATAFLNNYDIFVGEVDILGFQFKSKTINNSFLDSMLKRVRLLFDKAKMLDRVLDNMLDDTTKAEKFMRKNIN